MIMIDGSAHAQGGRLAVAFTSILWTFDDHNAPFIRVLRMSVSEVQVVQLVSHITGILSYFHTSKHNPFLQLCCVSFFCEFHSTIL